MTVAYDAGVLIAADKGDRKVWKDHQTLLEDGVIPTTTAPVVAQVSRSPRQARLRALLKGCEILPMTREDAHEVGALLAAARTTDVVDAHLVVVAARQGAIVVTSDPKDIRPLARHAKTPVSVQVI